MNAKEFGDKIKTRKCQSGKWFVPQIARQIDRQSHNSGMLHDYNMSMDVWIIMIWSMWFREKN